MTVNGLQHGFSPQHVFGKSGSTLNVCVSLAL